MTDYAITGKKGSGKTLLAVGLARDAFRAGKRVAGNVDIYLEHLLSPHSKTTYTRLPDRPNIADFEAIGRGQDGVAEENNGVLLLDESGISFNSRNFADKGRQAVLDWIAQARKFGWDVYYIAQGLVQIDKQIRETQIEYHVPVKNTEKWPIPIITPLASLVGITVKWPKFHIGILKYGIERDAMICERKWYRGRDLYAAYNTQQLFLDRDHPNACGIHTRLSPWTVRGRYLGWWEMNKHILAGGLMMGAVIGAVAGGYAGYEFGKPKEEPAQAEIKVDDSIRATGSFFDGLSTMVMLSDGRTVPSSAYRAEGLVDYYMVGGKWVRSQ